MDEAAFDRCTDPHAMLSFLTDRARLSERKARLVAAACCRRCWHLLVDERSRKAVEVAEQYADGAADRTARASAEADANRAAGGLRGRSWFVALAAKMATAGRIPLPAVIASTPSDDLLRPEEIEARRCGQADLLRDLIGPLPFRQVLFDPSWRTPAVMALATVIYDDRRFEDLPILADALEEAGADDAEILGHLRQKEPSHVRGCWCLDLVIGKE